MERLSPQDAMFLAVEDDRNPMHIGNVSVFKGPAPTYGDLVRIVASHLPRLPRYRQRVCFVPLGLGRPVWVDDTNFQLLYHIRHTATPPPGSSEDLRNLAGRVFAQSLDRAKPLWELWMVEGLEAGRWALVSKVHHCMADGESATDLLTALLDTEPQARPGRAPHWDPARSPGGRNLVVSAMADAVADPVHRILAIPGLARAAVGLGLAGHAPDLGSLTASIASLREPAAGSLNGPIGPHRRWSWANATLADVKEVRAAFGGTVNDVVLSAITSGFRELLRSRHQKYRGKVVRALVPVSVRSAGDRGICNNRVSAAFPGLPVGLADPVERLAAVKRQMDAFKRSGQAVAGDVLVQLTALAPPALVALGVRLAVHSCQQLLQTVATNVHGPANPLYAAGRQMLYGYPYVPIAGSVRTGVAVFSYLGGINFGVTADYDSVPDLDVLVRGIESGIAELLERARGTEVGPRPSARPKMRSPRPALHPAGIRRTIPRRRATRTRAGVEANQLA